MTLERPAPELAELVGAATIEEMDRALRHPPNQDPGEPPTGCPLSGTGLHELWAQAVEYCHAWPGGGVALCAHCRRPIFVGPETCHDRLERDDDVAEIVVDHATGRRAIAA